MTEVFLQNITECSAEHQRAVREIRNQQSVRRSMYTEHEITIAEHESWLKNIEVDDTQIVFVVFIQDTVSGVVSVNAIDKLHKKSDWAFYLSENVRGGLGVALEYAFITFIFEKLHIEKLNCEVIETNESVVNLHKKFGFVEEGLRRENIEKDGKRIGVFFLGLTKSDWNNSKPAVYRQYRKAFEKFVIKVKYTHA